MIKLLLNFPGIDTEITNNFGETPLMVAKEYCQNKVFVEEYQKKMDDDKAKANENIKAAEKVKTAESRKSQGPFKVPCRAQ